jgi:2-dehydro-3-deoxygalactonokinase
MRLLSLGRRINPDAPFTEIAMSAPALISIDWGTSSFRAYLADDRGHAIEEIPSGKGALALAAGEHEPYLAGRLADWKARFPNVPMIASGMVGARQGWLEAPYAACPAGFPEIAAATVIAPSPTLGGVRIIPGVSARDATGAPDVMRGEETQILGALVASGADSGLFVLPGTHSKWARVQNGRIVGFQTYMTGEVFSVLREHSVLGRMMAPMAEGADASGFALGVDAAARMERPGDLLHRVFMARTFGLFGEVPPEQLSEYLSGLLIAAEILAGARGARAATVVGSHALVARYAAAGARLGVGLADAPDNCATLGQIAVLRGI